MTGPPERALGDVVVHRHLRPVEEDAQSLAVVHQRAQRLRLARAVRQFGQLPFGIGEEAIGGFFQRGLGRLERCRLSLEGRGS